MDAYYASGNVLKLFLKQEIHLISRVRITTVGYTEFCRNPTYKGAGRPRKWGEAVKLRPLFAPIDDFLHASVWLYGQRVTVRYQCFQFYLDSTDKLVLSVLTQLPNGKQLILLSSDLNLTGQQVIEAYGWRFKIEVTFRTRLQVLGGFSYRFWLKSMEKSPKWPKNMTLADYPQAFHAQVHRKVEAFERFINLNAIVLGLLQVLALERPKTVWNHFPLWFRTVPKHGYPTERIVKLSIQRQLLFNLFKRTPSLLLTKLLDRKSRLPQHLEWSSLTPFGRPKQDSAVQFQLKRQERLDESIRVWIEGKFGQAKRRFSLARVMTKLAETSESAIAITFLVLNLEQWLRFLFSLLFGASFLSGSSLQPLLELWNDFRSFLLKLNRLLAPLPLARDPTTSTSPSDPRFFRFAAG